MLIAFAGILYVGYLFMDTEPVDADTLYQRLQQTSYVYDSKGELIDTLYFEDRTVIEAKTVPDEVKNAFIAIEDKTFYKHHGFNFKRMGGAIWSKLTGKSDAISGTSTITQQLARNVYLADIKSQRTISRKLKEMIYAVKIEKAMTKDEILEAYLNTIYLGYGCYGIESAAETYFSKKPEELNIDEIAILAALPQAPDTYAPLKTESSETTTKISDGLYADSACEERRDLVLDLMCEQGFISEEEKEDAKKPVAEVLNPSIQKKNSLYTYFKDYLIQQVIADLVDQYSMTEEDAEETVYTGGLKIYSTINTDAQKVVTSEFENDYNFPGNYGEQITQGAMVITEVGTGKIIAMVGGRYTSGEKLFNRAVDPRQPGSSVKPLSIYSAALQKSYEYQMQGKRFEFADYDIDNQGTKYWGDYITAASTVIDEPTYIKGKKWPLNATRTYTGSQTVRTALQESINTCAVKILYQIGIDYSSDMLQKFGISTVELTGATNDMNDAALALGAMSHGITPLEMALAYGTFPNNGARCEPISYTKVEDSEGNVLLASNAKEVQVLDSGVAWIMTDMLKSVVTDGLGKPADISGVQVGGKTGTSDVYENLWFAGFTPSYSAALWLGTDDNSELTTGSASAARLWGRIMNQIPEVKEGSYKAQPGNVIRYGGEYFTMGTEAYGNNRSSSGSSNSTANSSLFEDTERASSNNTTESNETASTTTNSTPVTNNTPATNNSGSTDSGTGMWIDNY